MLYRFARGVIDWWCSAGESCGTVGRWLFYFVIVFIFGLIFAIGGMLDSGAI